MADKVVRFQYYELAVLPCHILECFTDVNPRVALIVRLSWGMMSRVGGEVWSEGNSRQEPEREQNQFSTEELVSH